MKNNVLTIVITLVMAVILTGSLLMPTLDSAAESYYHEVEYSNISGTNQIYLSPVNAETSNTINVSSENIVTNGGTIEYWEDTAFSNVVLLTDSIYVVVSGAGVITITTANGTSQATSSFTAVVSAGEITYSIDEQATIQITYTAGYIADPNGAYVSCPTSFTRYYDSMNFAQIRYDSGYYAFIDGNGYKDGSAYSMDVTSSEVSDTDGTVHTLTSIKYTSTKSLTSVCVMEKVAIYGYTDNPGIVSLLGAIGPIVICSILLTAVSALVIRRNND